MSTEKQVNFFGERSKTSLVMEMVHKNTNRQGDCNGK